MKGRRPLASVALTATVLAACGGGGATPATPGRSSTDGSGGGSPTTLPTVPKIHASVVADLPRPLGMAYRPGDDALYIVSKRGTVWALRGGAVDPTPALDLSSAVSTGSEQGLLGLAFSPSGQFAYVDYTDRNGDTNVVEYAWADGRADPSTRRRVLFVRQPFPNHNGGDLAFGPDGYLYVGMGDGGWDYSRGDPQGDPDRNGQNLGVLLGKLLRIGPRPAGGRPYGIPPDNPFAGRPGARPEIWAYGLRNPWRYSFDRSTGDLWIGDVGAGDREEIDMQPAGSAGGQNYGWNALEGTVAWRAPPAGAVPPVYEYDHRRGSCSVTGGFVYRGEAIPNLVGWYVFGDYCTGVIHVLRLDPDGAHAYVAAGAVIQQLASFGEDQGGELYALSLTGTVYALVP